MKDGIMGSKKNLFTTLDFMWSEKKKNPEKSLKNLEEGRNNDHWPRRELVANENELGKAGVQIDGAILGYFLKGGTIFLSSTVWGIHLGFYGGGETCMASYYY